MRPVVVSFIHRANIFINLAAEMFMCLGCCPQTQLWGLCNLLDVLYITLKKYINNSECQGFGSRDCGSGQYFSRGAIGSNG